MEQLIKLLVLAVEKIGIAAVLAVGLTFLLIQQFPALRETIVEVKATMIPMANSLEKLARAIEDNTKELRDHRRVEKCVAD